MSARTPAVADPTLPCGYCCDPVPCGSTDPDHDGMSCDACAAVPMSPAPHPECERMVAEYMEDERQRRERGEAP